MSRTTIYRCDICGDESTKGTNWELDSEVFARWGNHSGAHVDFARCDICPKCAERIEAEFSKAWEKVKVG